MVNIIFFNKYWQKELSNVHVKKDFYQVLPIHGKYIMKKKWLHKYLPPTL